MSFAVLRSALQTFPRSCSGVRYFHSAVSSRPAPPPRGSIQSTSDFLAAIGRSCEAKLKVTEWEGLWRMRGADLKKAGVSVSDRRYILWSMEKYRRGQDPALFAHEEQPQKQIRGWGPSVQFGKRIRSRRHR